LNEVGFVPPLSRPDYGSMGKTGTWRNYKPVIDYSGCIKCLLCWLYCPESVIQRLEDDNVVIDYEYCKGCGVCANQCPVKVIKMVPEV